MRAIPTLESIKEAILTSLKSEFGVNPNPYGESFLEAMATVQAGQLWNIWLETGFTQKNVWYDTADPDQLTRWGFEILARYPFPAGQAKYTATVTGTLGATIAANTTFQADNSATSPGKLFMLTGGDYTLPGTTGTITIQAVEGGTDSTLQVGDTLTCTNPLLNVSTTITVASLVTAPTDAETLEAYRLAIRNKVQLDPGSWSAADYRLVGLDVAGVGNTYAYAQSGYSNRVAIYIKGTTPGTPASSTVLTNYGTALDLVRPIQVTPVIAASTIRNVDVTVVMGTFPAFTSAQQSLIEEAIRAFVNSVEPFIAACDAVADRNDRIATYNLSRTVSLTVPGLGFSDVTFEVAGTPTTNWQADNGEIPFLNSVIFA